jgi:hypothetical protein
MEIGKHWASFLHTPPWRRESLLRSIWDLIAKLRPSKERTSIRSTTFYGTIVTLINVLPSDAVQSWAELHYWALMAKRHLAVPGALAIPARQKVLALFLTGAPTEIQNAFH